MLADGTTTAELPVGPSALNNEHKADMDYSSIMESIGDGHIYQ
jgi:hypothetical protein